MNKQLALHGIGMPVVNANGSISTITLSAHGITLEGFTVTGSGDSVSDAGIKVASSNDTLSGFFTFWVCCPKTPILRKNVIKRGKVR